MNQEDYLCHHGIKGMKWGRRKDRSNHSGSSKKEAKKSTMKSYRSDKGPKRFKAVNAANSAARSFYRAQRANDFGDYKKASNKQQLKEARLTESQIKNGRYRVARARSIKRNIASIGVGVGVGVASASAITATGGAALPAILASVGASGATTAIGHFKSGAHYYGKQRRAYGGTRAKYQNQ